MTKRKPLDLMQKWFVAQYWAQQKPPLTRSSFVVLMRLLDRQNTKTGRCDPSAIGLIDDTGFSERSIRSAFKELEERGAVKRYRQTRRSRNQFMIFSTEELGQNARRAGLKPRSGQRTGLHPVSAQPATHCRSSLQRPAPETIKETKKKKENAEKGMALGGTSRAKSQSASSSEMDLAEFERRVAKVFDREGYGYEGLLALSAQDLELTYGQLVSGEMSFSRAVGQLLETYRAANNPPK